MSGCTLEDASKRVGKDVATVDRWESDNSDELPTLAQAKKLETLYRYPLTLFLADELPRFVNVPDVSDFRTLADGEPPSPSRWSRNLRWLLRQLEFRQDFVKEVADRYEIPQQAWVSSESLPNVSTEELASKMRELLRVSRNEQARVRKTSDALKMWIRKFEDEAGVFVFQTNNNSGPVDLSEMRGVSIADNHAPLIALNSKDSEAGRIFTLFHEFAHLWIGASGISGWDGLEFKTDSPAPREVERFCDQVAAEALMPRNWFMEVWNVRQGVDLEANVERVSRAFNVSREAVAVRAVHLSEMNWNQYSALRSRLSTERAQGPMKTAEGGNYYATHMRNLGRKYVGLILESFSDRYIGIKEAASLLEVKVNNVHALAEQAGYKV